MGARPREQLHDLLTVLKVTLAAMQIVRMNMRAQWPLRQALDPAADDVCQEEPYDGHHDYRL
jgi:hypothetical protein